MAYPEFLTTGWQDSVRRICGGLSTTDVSDAFLGDDLFAIESEDFIQREVPDSLSLKTAKATELRRATIYHIAFKVCQYLAKKLNQSETFGDFRFELQNIDWEREAFKNYEQCRVYLELVKEGTVVVLTVFDISERYPPIYDDIIVLET